jgi:adenylate kinase
MTDAGLTQRHVEAVADIASVLARSTELEPALQAALSGKGTQGERLQEDFRLPYYATGDILRAAVKEGTEVGKQAKEFMDRGDLVPDEVIIGVIAERLQREEAADGFILDGFPRTLPQAEALDEKMKELGRELSAAILIEVPDDEVARRLGGRRTCEENGHVFHVEFNPPEKEGVCDIDGSALIVRDDDKPEVIANRLETYREKTEPLIGYYEERGVLQRVQGDADPSDVEESIHGVLATLKREEEMEI